MDAAFGISEISRIFPRSFLPSQWAALKHYLAMNASHSSRTHSRHAGAADRAPRIERLEDRIAPANNVTTFFSGGTLTITTVDQLGEAEVLAGDNNQNFQILAAGPGNVTLHKNGNTTIDGGVVDVPFTGVVNIIIDLKDGDDFVVLKGGVNIPGDVTFKGGDGNNTFNLDGDVAGATSLRNLSITNGDGVDNIAFLETDLTLSGKLTINTGDGGSNMNFGFQAADNVTIAGDVSILAGAGADNVNFNGHDLLLKGAVSLKPSTGDNSVRFAYQNSAVLEKPITVVNGAGNSVFDVSSTNKTSSFAAIKITNSHGSNRVTFDSSVSDTISGDVTVTNGSGDNRFEVDSGVFFVGGKVKVTNGAGNSTTDITPAGANTVTGDFTLTNLAGNDTTTIGGTDVTYKNLKLLNGNGTSTTNLTGSDLSFASISSTSADGADTFTVNATSSLEIVSGGFTLKQGNGSTNTTIAAGGTAAIAGKVSITNGDGNDIQTIGNGGGVFTIPQSIAITNGRGGSITTFNPAQLILGGSIAVTSGEGFDAFTLGNGALTTFNISGSIKLTHGLGGSNSRLNPNTSGNLGGASTVTAADGNDSVDVIRSTLGGAMTLTLGAGNDSIEIDNSIVAALKFLTGSGNDQLRMENTTNDGINTTVFGTVNVDLGGGEDTIEWGLDANDVVTANQSVKLLGGLGLDTFDQNTATNAFILPPTLTSLEVQLP